MREWKKIIIECHGLIRFHPHRNDQYGTYQSNSAHAWDVTADYRNNLLELLVEFSIELL